MPIYETPEDRQRQIVAVLKMTRRFNFGSSVKIFWFPTRAEADALILGDKLNKETGELEDCWRLVEVKCRTIHSEEYVDYMIDKSKVVHCMEIAGRLCGNFILLVSWTDCLGMLHVTPEVIPSFRIGICDPRRDRDDANDRNECYYIPIKQFIRFAPKGALTEAEVEA
jgi:hypothetical protein